MYYFVGCMCPRRDDCYEGFKCREGMYCKELEVLSTDHAFRDSNRKYFDNESDAAEYLKEVQKRGTF